MQPEAGAGPAQSGPREAPLMPNELTGLARSLAQRPAAVGGGQPAPLLERLPALLASLERAYERLAGAPKIKVALVRAAEWHLQNHYVARQALREVRTDLPRGYLAELPRMTEGSQQGYPRVYALAQAVLEHTAYLVDMDVLVRFVEAYQSVTPLTTGELWAVPIMLRLGALEKLSSVLERLITEDLSEGLTEAGAVDEAAVGACYLTLRRLATVDWQEFVEQVSRVEAVLRRDPERVYRGMTQETRDRYHHVVEELAHRGGQSEEAVAAEAVRLAQEAAGAAEGRRRPRSAHVGYYLVDEGREALEAAVGYRPTASERAGRWLLAHPTLAYLGAIGLLTAALLLAAAGYAARSGGTALSAIAAGLLSLLPASAVAASVANWAVSHLVPPRLLPKLDFRSGIPAEHRALVVIPTLLSSRHRVAILLESLELHLLHNTDDSLSFALLTDFTDAPEEHMPEDAERLEEAVTGIQALNDRYEEASGRRPFLLLHRGRRWNPQEGVWMGWERKRGKLEELNRLILTGEAGGYSVVEGEAEALTRVRYVITVDEDTSLPHDTARRLVGALAHPLNRPEFAPDSNRLTAGYAVLQPRTEIRPTRANLSWFTRFFAGDAYYDLYSRAVSDVYQDLFGEGVYVGKGIYDVAAFSRCLAGRVPENAVLSHDLFEGIWARVGLVSDIVLLEGYPPTYMAWVRRMKRWVRGDWQLLPWLLPRVPKAGGGTAPNDWPAIGRWKVFDNLRRSLVAPANLALLLAAWWALPGSPLAWTGAALAATAAPLLLSAVTRAVGWLRPGSGRRWQWAPLVGDAARWALGLIFLPFESVQALDAIGTTLVRVFVTRRNLLQWVTARQSARRVTGDGESSAEQREMGSVALATGAVAMLQVLWSPATPWWTAPFWVAWMMAPTVAERISRPRRQRRVGLRREDRPFLRQVARRTWLYFERFVGPEHHWLPPDNYQEAPLDVVAPRTSPTNMGLLLLSTLAAYDLGYLGPLHLLLRLRYTLDTMAGLERHRGHWLNWYDTHSLAPLAPRYVSAVDSGNLAGCLLAVKQGVEGLRRAPAVRWDDWQGWLDAVAALQATLEPLTQGPGTAAVRELRRHLARSAREVEARRDDPRSWASLLLHLSQGGMRELEELVRPVVDEWQAGQSVEGLAGLRLWLERLQHHLAATRHEWERLAPWALALAQRPPLLEEAGPAWRELVDALPVMVALEDVPDVCRRAQELLAPVRTSVAEGAWPAEGQEEALAWCRQLEQSLEAAASEAQRAVAAVGDLCARTEAYFQEMDLSFLYDRQRHLFRIGYNVDTGVLDANTYDLLASEARLASLLAIAKGDVPQRHWLQLGRPVTQAGGARLLLSWSGSMFEYLMPNLLTRTYPDTTLGQSCLAAIDRQVAYGRQKRVPWGISESAFYRFDGQQVYQYRAFGVPGLGFKQGLTEDLVIAPYATTLALPLRPAAAVRNLRRLRSLGMLGTYGFYEAADYTAERVPKGEEMGLVRAYMAHHHGMSLVALTNTLQPGAMTERFHADLRVRSVDLLLQEGLAPGAPVELPHPSEVSPMELPEPAVRLRPWSVPPYAAGQQAHLLSNGRYGVLITQQGSGASYYEGTQLTRWRPDATGHPGGTVVYVQDVDSGDLWSATQQPVGSEALSQEVRFHAHMAEFRRREHEISLEMQVVVAPEDDLEVRRVRLTNHSGRIRRLAITSYGEVVLGAHGDDQSHPAFHKLFVASEYVASARALLFRRRPRTGRERNLTLAHLAVVRQNRPDRLSFETDRRAFVGRGRSLRAPAALDAGRGRLEGGSGATLDPILALRQPIELLPFGTAQLAFVTLVAPSREDALAAARRFGSWRAIGAVFSQARSRSAWELERVDLTIPQVADIQRLLSLLVVPQAGLRATPATLAANVKGQAGLWPYAISGDYPIVLASIGSEAEMPLVLELLQAHAYWRQRQFLVDLVILNEQDTTYTQELQGRLIRLVALAEGDSALYQRGGVYLLPGGQVPKADRVLLQTAARAVLEGPRGSLAAQLGEIKAEATRLPDLAPTRKADEAVEPTPPLERPADLLFDNGLGGFTPDQREYVVFLKPGQTTPAPWVNVIANPRFGFLVSEAGSGYTWAENSSENRLTPWNNDPVCDAPGEALYLRDEETAEVWTPTRLPAGDGAACLARHGAGYTILEQHRNGLRQRVRLFAAPDDPVKLVHLRLENTWERPRRLTATYYAEWVLGTTQEETQAYLVPEFEDSQQALLVRNPYHPEHGQRVAFLAASEPLHGLTADRSEFLGPGGGVSAPAALRRIGLEGAVRAGLDPCGAVQVHVDLAPGEVKELHFLLGQGADREEALDLVERYCQAEAAQAAWEDSQALWDRLLGQVTVRTPEPAMDVLLNRWLLYQAVSCRLWGRSALYQSGGAFGYRDQLQDVLALVHAAPELAREHLLLAAAHQFEEGDVVHWWHPPQARGVRTRCSDDLLWLPFATAHYVEATGDAGVLDEQAPFLQGQPLAAGQDERYGQYPPTEATASLYEHCRRAIEKGMTAGPHGLPLMGTGDWNDGMNRVGEGGRGESIWLGWFAYTVLTRFADVCDGLAAGEWPARAMDDDDDDVGAIHELPLQDAGTGLPRQEPETGLPLQEPVERLPLRGRDEELPPRAQAIAYRQRAEALRIALEEAGWDGGWYRRAYYDDGTPLGSAQNDECQIDALAQSWAVLSGAADRERAALGMEAVERRLVSEREGLIRLFTPPFDKTAHDPGYIKGYPPGIRENGGQYTHAAIWTVWALAELGQGDRAMALFDVLNPISHSDTPDRAQRYRVEPYVVAADVYGISPHVGRGGWSWYTGSASWLYRLGVEGLLGVQRRGGALRINPCLPAHWREVEVAYRAGAATYRIAVRNPAGVCRGVKELTVDGRAMPANEFPLVDDGGEHTVDVLLG